MYAVIRTEMGMGFGQNGRSCSEGSWSLWKVPAQKGIKVVCFGSLVQISDKQRLWIGRSNSDGWMLAVI